MDYNYNNNMDYYNPQSARYYQNFSNQGGNVGDLYSKNEHDNNLYPRSPQYENHAQNDYRYSNPNNISSHSNARYKNPYTTPFNDTKTSYNTPYIPSPVKHPSSPVMPGMNPTHPPINPIPTHQVPYGGRPADPYSDSALSKGMYSTSSTSSPNPGPTNHGQENPLSPTTAVLLWARPPKVDFLGIVPSPNGLPAYNANTAGFDFNFGLQIQVDNPNIVGANFEMIKAIAFYPGHSDPIGGGNLTDVTIAAKGKTIIDFPFSVNYNKDIDPGFAILFDIAQKCGLTGGGEKQKLEIDYKLTLTIKILLITINPSLDRKAMIDCPIKDGKIPNIPGFDIGKAAKQIGVQNRLTHLSPFSTTRSFRFQPSPKIPCLKLQNPQLHFASLQKLHFSNKSPFTLPNDLRVFRSQQIPKESVKVTAENENITHKVAQLAKEETNINEKSSAAAVTKKKPLTTRIKDEITHYWHGTKLLGLEIKISTKLLYKLLKGQKLTRREHRQLRRTTQDLVRLVPFLVFIIVPFMEFLLPIALKLFPNMLPSTFEDKFSKEEKKRKLLKVRLEMAKFLQETIAETGTTGLKSAEAAKEFTEFFRKVRSTGEQASTEDLLRIANIFEDELTLDNLSRPQLVSMCRYMNLNAFGTDNFLRYQIRNQMRSIREDDKMIMAEGVDSLTIPELQHACQSRGIRTIGVSPARLRSELNQWLDLHLNHKVPSTLLILSRAFSFADRNELANQAEALQATLNSLPDNLVNETELQVSEADEEAARRAQKEAEEAAKEAALAEQLLSDVQVPEEDVRMTEEQLQELRVALSILSSKSAVLEEREALNEIKEDREEYKEDMEELGKHTESKVQHRLGERLEKMIQKIDKELEQYDSEVGSKFNLIQANESGQISVHDLEEALRIIKHTPGDNERIKKIVKKLDVDGDGLVFLDHISELCTEGEGLGVLVKKEPENSDEKVKKPKKEDIIQT
ncbi:14614_t:CDS:10 [Rhizophagus irregularis]|nr:14614_t:CDS:10 [Rhizophagus irregularis]